MTNRPPRTRGIWRCLGNKDCYLFFVDNGNYLDNVAKDVEVINLHLYESITCSGLVRISVRGGDTFGGRLRRRSRGGGAGLPEEGEFS